jgi:hexosaminidase
MKIKASLAGFILCTGVATASVADTNGPAIIPLPQKMELRAGTFTLTPDTPIYVDPASRETENVLTDRLRRSTGYPLTTLTNFICRRAPIQGRHSVDDQGCQHKSGRGRLRSDRCAGFSRHSRPDARRVCSTACRLCSNCCRRKYFPRTRVTNVDWQMPCVQIEDWPRFKWRGLMLDVPPAIFSARTKSSTILDAMAMHKVEQVSLAFDRRSRLAD